MAYPPSISLPLLYTKYHYFVHGIHFLWAFTKHTYFFFSTFLIEALAFFPYDSVSYQTKGEKISTLNFILSVTSFIFLYLYSPPPYFFYKDINLKYVNFNFMKYNKSFRRNQGRTKDDL